MLRIHANRAAAGSPRVVRVRTAGGIFGFFRSNGACFGESWLMVHVAVSVPRLGISDKQDRKKKTAKAVAAFAAAF